MLSELDRFMSKVARNGDEDECWPWEGGKAKGYGRFMLDGRQQQAHRVAYELFVGPIPEGLDLDHVCHNESDCPGGSSCSHRACVNPAHLEPATRSENLRRGRAGEHGTSRNREKTHCSKGHPYDEVNTYFATNGHRFCRACGREYATEKRDRLNPDRSPPNAAKTHCIEGHPLSGDNLYVYKGRRLCRACRAAAARRFRRKN